MSQGSALQLRGPSSGARGTVTPPPPRAEGLAVVHLHRRYAYPTPSVFIPVLRVRSKRGCLGRWEVRHVYIVLFFPHLAFFRFISVRTAVSR
jgi:hypothetical protein